MHHRPSDSPARPHPPRHISSRLLTTTENGGRKLPTIHRFGTHRRWSGCCIHPSIEFLFSVSLSLPVGHRTELPVHSLKGGDAIWILDPTAIHRDAQNSSANWWMLNSSARTEQLEIHQIVGLATTITITILTVVIDSHCGLTLDHDGRWMGCHVLLWCGRPST
ncbi:hypothetical protein EX30DRAFT_71013 [Ascodesmis nigricans]|uniref:Uncharacterized protein n=1 Tax=Ascodesmis nigricans TaxID=341454 RepID=A0A4S2MTN7_9PEZI|nr:hypothetical protein EX30DRAFT_71013 [Ascodesmis nigricans]